MDNSSCTINPNGICFMCRKSLETSYKFSDSSKKSIPKYFSLHKLCRYLQIEWEKLFSPCNSDFVTVELQMSSTSKRKRSNMDVELCDDCNILADDFTQFYNILEETKLHLNATLQKIRATMEEVAETGTEMEESSLSESKVNVSVQCFMKEIIKKCFVLNEKTLPKLCLERVSIPPPTSVAAPPVLKMELDDSNYLLNECEDNDPDPDWEPSSPPPQSDVNDDEVELTSDEGDEPEPAVPVKISTSRLPVKRRGRRKKEPRVFKCPSVYCKAQFESAIQQLERHIINFHCDIHFEKHRLKSVPSSSFAKIVMHHLFEDFLEDEKDATNCKICGTEWKCKARDKHREAQGIKLHLLKLHHSVLVKKVKELQNDPDVLEKASVDENYLGETCSCGQYAPSDRLFLLHKRLHCKFTGEKPENSDLFTCDKCGLIYASKGSFKNHNCGSQNKNLKANKITFKCKDCGKRVNSLWMERHRTTLCKSLKRKKKITKLKKKIKHEFTNSSEGDGERNAINLNSVMEMDVQVDLV